MACSGDLPALSRSHSSSAAWKLARCCLASAPYSASDRRALARSRAGGRTERSGMNSSASASGSSPCAARSSFSSGRYFSGESGWPNCRRARWSGSVSSPRISASITALLASALSLRTASARASVSFAIRAAPSSSTIVSVPTTWCRWVMQKRSRVLSEGFSANDSSARRACLSVSSISVTTQPSVLRSTLVCVLMSGTRREGRDTREGGEPRCHLLPSPLVSRPSSLGYAGSLKPATEAWSSRARSESLPIDSAVWREPEDVSVVVS